MTLQEFKSRYEDICSMHSTFSHYLNQEVVDYNTEQLFNLLNNTGLLLVSGGRQMGKTARISAYLSLNMDKKILIISPKLAESRHLLENVKSYFHFQGITTITPNFLNKFGNIDIIESNKPNILGKTYDIVIIESGAYLKKLPDIITSLIPILTDGGKIIVTSDPSKGSYFNSIYKSLNEGIQFITHFNQKTNNHFFKYNYHCDLEKYQESVIGHVF